MYTMNSFAHNRSVNRYAINEILTASPEKLIIKLYDFAIMNCQKHNMVKTNEALQVLINALNFDSPATKETSVGFFKLYSYCQEQMRKKNYDVVYKVLSELKETWESALSKR